MGRELSVDNRPPGTPREHPAARQLSLVQECTHCSQYPQTKLPGNPGPTGRVVIWAERIGSLSQAAISCCPCGQRVMSKIEMTYVIEIHMDIWHCLDLAVGSFAW